MFYCDGLERVGGYLGEFIVPLPQAIDPTLETIVAAWFEGPSGRTVKLRIGEVEAVARSAIDAASFLRYVHRFSERPLTIDGEKIV